MRRPTSAPTPTSSSPSPTPIGHGGLGVVEAPAFFVRQDGEVIAKAEGWNADEWRAVTESIAEFTHRSRPPMPADGDPGTHSGTPISA